MEKIKKEFFAEDTEIVAKNLLWKIIKVWNKKWIIIETEAYKQNCDEASHAFWKKTQRNALMYDTYGFVYVYLIYGMYYCLNFTTDQNKAGAVLIRWILEIPESLKWLKNNLSKLKKIDGCGKVCLFFKIDKSFNWLNLTNNDKIKLFDSWIQVKNVKITQRKWISKAKDKLWRFIREI